MIQPDGSYSKSQGSITPLTGQVPQADLDALKAAIAAADFKAIAAVPFTGTCPTAFDGSDLIYTFGAPGEPQQIDSCVVAVDFNAPLFKAVLKVQQDTQR